MSHPLADGPYRGVRGCRVHLRLPPVTEWKIQVHEPLIQKWAGKVPDACEFPGRFPKFHYSAFSSGEKLLFYCWFLNLEYDRWFLGDKALTRGDPLIMLKSFLPPSPALSSNRAALENGRLFLEPLILIDAHGALGQRVHVCEESFLPSRERNMIFI